MSKRIIAYSISILLSIFFIGCTTYTNFYSKTYSTIPTQKVSEIRRLDLSYKNLKTLPNSIDRIKDLRMINLSNNPELNLNEAFKKLANFEHLEILILDSLNITELPTSITSIINLKQLSLVNNPDIQLDSTIKLLSELPIEFLNLSKNNINQLPSNITDLNRLRDLNLSYNQLKGEKNFELLGMLPDLYSLWLDHNHLKTLPDAIEALKQIRFLYLDHNQLSELPEAMSRMKKVWVIHLGYNQFKELPEVFTQMRILLMVHINNNMITTVPKVYTTEKYPLAGLILDNNPINGTEKEKAKRLFKKFFLLSFDQN